MIPMLGAVPPPAVAHGDTGQRPLPAGPATGRSEATMARDNLTANAVEPARQPDVAPRALDRTVPRPPRPEDPSTLAGPPPSFQVSTLEQELALDARLPDATDATEGEARPGPTGEDEAAEPALAPATGPQADFETARRVIAPGGPTAVDITR